MTVSNAAMDRLRDIGLDEYVADRFEVVREVGRGGAGRVFEAIDGETGERVALKILDSQRVADLARFNLEASVLEELSHPAIVRYLAHGVTSADEHFIATEWLEGETLATKLAREGRLGVIETMVLARDLSRALAIVHARGVIHRDLKPSNVFLVGGKLEASKVLDFGLARRTGQNLTRPGEVMGTVGFMAPEQAQGKSTIDGRADLFSLGCLLYACLTGRSAFEGEDAMAVLAKVMLAAPTPPRTLRPSIPLELETLVMQLLAKEPRERPQSGQAAADAIEIWLRDPTGAPSPRTTAVMEPVQRPGPPLVAAPPPARARSIAFVALGVAFVALGVSIVAAYGSLRQRDAEEEGAERIATASTATSAARERTISPPITVMPSEVIEVTPVPEASVPAIPPVSGPQVQPPRAAPIPGPQPTTPPLRPTWEAPRPSWDGPTRPPAGRVDPYSERF